MVAALIVIPAGVLLALLFAAWLAWDVLSRPRGDGPDDEAVRAARQATGGVPVLQAAGVLAIGLVLALVAGLTVGALRESFEHGVLAGLAAMAGVIALAGAALPGTAMVTQSVERVAGAPSAPGALAGRAAAIGPFVATSLAIAALGGLLALATQLLDHATADAPLMVVSFAAGAIVAGLLLHLVSAPLGSVSGIKAAALPLTAPVGSPALAGAVAASLAGSMVLASPIVRATGDAEWLLLPLVLASFGVVAAIAGVLAWPGWERLTGSPREGVAGAMWTTAVVAAGGLVAACVLVVGDAWSWAFFAGLVGVAGAAGLVMAGQHFGQRGASGPLHLAAATAAIVAVVVVLGFAAGRQIAVGGVEPVALGIFGAGVATTALLTVSVVAMSIAGSVALTRGAAALSPGRERLLDGCASAAGRATGRYTACAVFLAGIVLFLAFMAAVRDEFGRTAFKDPERYAANLHALGLLAPDPGAAAAAAVAALDYADELVAVRSLSEADRERFMVATAREASGLADGLALDDGAAQRVGLGSPVPLPAVLPLSLARPEVLGGALAAVVVIALVAALATRAAIAVAGLPGESATPVAVAAARAWRWPWVPLGIAAAAPAVIALAFRFGFGGDGPEGWLALGAANVAGLLVAFFIATACSGIADRPEEDTVAGAALLGALLLPAVALLLVPLAVA